MNNITLNNNIDINPDIIAKSIYSGEIREYSEQGVELNIQIIAEFNQLLAAFTQFVWQKRTSYYRVDAYFDDDKLYILDINASFVDGWWNAMNMSRAMWNPQTSDDMDVFPENFYLQDGLYRPEFELFRSELEKLWISSQEVFDVSERYKTYAYWVFDKKENLFPFDGVRIDNKMNLALFSKIWEWNNIEIPNIILPSDCSWQDTPKDFVYKITWKSDISNRWTWKVKIWKPKKWAWAWKQWENYKMVAQQPVETLKNSKGQSMQLIIMCANDQAITGYVQSSVSDIINDNSVQSPLILSK